MHILIVSATELELAPCAAELRAHPGHRVELLATGVGMVATAAWCSRALAERRYDLALNFGVCGAFDPRVEPGTVVHVVKDQLAEIGAEDGEAFLTLEDLKLRRTDPLRLDGDVVVNPAPPDCAGLNGLPAAVGITVNAVHGHEPSIARALERFGASTGGRPLVESMEGAAFMYSCLIHRVPFAQVRAVSNIVERRDRGAWRMEDAICNLGAAAMRILDSLPEDPSGLARS